MRGRESRECIACCSVVRPVAQARQAGHRLRAPAQRRRQPRKLGQPLWDTNTPFEVTEKLTAPQGLGIVEEFKLALELTDATVVGTGKAGFAGDGARPRDAPLNFETGGNPEPSGALALGPARQQVRSL